MISGRAPRSDHKSLSGAAPGRGGRMSRQRKMAALLRLLRGEDLARNRLPKPRRDSGDAEWLARGVPRRRRGGAGDETLDRRGVGKRPPEGEARCGADRARLVAREDRHPGGEPPFGPEEVEAMGAAVSPVSGRPYGLSAVSDEAGHAFQ